MISSIKKIAAFGLLSALVACSPGPSNNTIQPTAVNKSSIIGGAPVVLTDSIAKTTVAIVLSVTDKTGKESQFICTGSMLRPNIVITAGHCAPAPEDGQTVKLYVVFNTDLNKLQKGDVQLVTATVVHPQYGKTGDQGEDANDLSLLKISGTMPTGYQVATLLDDESLLKVGGAVTLAGYGLTDGVAGTGDNRLRKVDINIEEMFGKTEVVLDQSQGKGACHGDSGGPAFLAINGTEYLWGITSRGIGKDGKDDCSLLSIYTKIKSQNDFVQSALKQLGSN